MQRRFDLAQVTVQLQKNILRNLFGQTTIAGHAQGKRKDHRLVLVDQLLEVGLPVTGHKSLLPSIPRECAERDAEDTGSSRKSSEKKAEKAGLARLKRNQSWCVPLSIV